MELAWPREVAVARRQQAELVASLPPDEPLAGYGAVGGLDVSYSKRLRRVFACLVVLDRRGRLLQEVLGTAPLDFPYVPGLLSYREGPACCTAWNKLKQRPDVLICDGQGRAHPRRLGLAAHLGLVFEIPTIGVGKSRLIGEYVEPGPSKGARSELVDPRTGETLGCVLRSRDNVKPLFVSVGVRITLEDALDVVLEQLDRFRLPEPQRLADRRVTARRKAAEEQA